MPNMLVSVVIPVTPERASLLKRALRSVERQTYPRLEVIVVQDGPGDGVAEVCGSHVISRPLRLVQVAERSGAARARNLGARVACGEVLAFLDSDDEWFPEKIALQMRCLEDERTGVVGSDSFMMDDASGWMVQKRLAPLRGDVFRQLALSSAGIQTSFMLVRRDYFESAGGFDEGKSFCQERDLQLRLAKRCRFDWVMRPLGIQHFNHGSRQLSLHIANVEEGIRTFYDSWEAEVRREWGEAGVEQMRGWLFRFLINARKRQLEQTDSFRDRMKIVLEVLGDGRLSLGPVDFGKIFVLGVVGSRAVKVWRRLR